MGVNPDTGAATSYRVLWPGAMAVLAGIDLLGKFLAGSDEKGKVGERFKNFLEIFLTGTSPTDQETIYQLRNSLLHSFGLYSEDKGTVYRFFLTNANLNPFISNRPPDQYWVDIQILHREFEKAVAGYKLALDADPALQAKFSAMFPKYGRIHVG